VLAIVAFRQPVTRSGIEHIRGSFSNCTIATLLERRLIAHNARQWPDDESVSVTALSTVMLGNVRGETMRAFTAEEMQRIVQRLP
jgi:uncharacterized protein with GYD domain